MSSVITLSAARQTPATSRNITSAATILGVIFTCHFTPVERIQKGGFFAPRRLHPHVQIEIDLHAEEGFHLLPRQRADTLQSRALRADHNGLLPGPFDADRCEDARQ